MAFISLKTDCWKWPRSARPPEAEPEAKPDASDAPEPPDCAAGDGRKYRTTLLVLLVLFFTLLVRGVDFKPSKSEDK